MSARVREHLRSNLVAYLALFLALGLGTAWASHPGGINTISSHDVINDDVPGGGLRSRDLADTASGSDRVNANRLDGLNSSDLQRRVTGVCSGGSSIRVIDADGTVTCEADDDSGGSAVTGRITGIPGTGGDGQILSYGAPSGLSQRSAASATVETLSPNATITARDLFARSTSAPGDDNQIIVRLMVNGAPALGCGIQGNSTTCATQNNQEAAVPPGSTLAIEATSQDGPASQWDLLFGWRGN